MGDLTRKKPYLVLGVRYKERKNNPPPGLAWYKTKDGDTLEMIAYDYGLREIDLALMNWHTDKTNEINWYLYNFLGWSKPEGKFYVFSPVKDKDKGWILIPDIPDSIKKAPPQKVDAARGGKSTLDSKLQVRVVEWLANGSAREVSGKWLYVFSGQSGKDFGYKPPPLPPGKDAPPSGQPGTAFPLRKPQEFHLAAVPDKLEYEIMITSETGPSSDLIKLATGLKDAGKPYYQVGNIWYFESDQAILKNATTENRSKRTTHAFQNRKTVLIDLAPEGKNKRYYFLLSPVQLGAEAIKFAIDNPNGLTPLLRTNARGLKPDPSKFDPDQPDQNIGPAPEDIIQNPITLPVIDPYSFAENIAEQVYTDALKTYIEWFSSKKNETIKELHEKTGWETLDHLYVAQVLKSVRDSHPKPGDIDDELVDAALWKENLKIWEKELNQRHSEINAAAHESLLWLIKVLESPGHKIIETAILKDTTGNKPHDEIDIAHGILHWAACTEHMFALEPGVVYLREVLDKTGSVPVELVTKHFKGLDKDAFTINVTETHLAGWRYGYVGLLKLQSLQEFVSPPPPISSNLTPVERRKLLAEYNQKKRDNLIKVLNNLKILPVEVKALPLNSLKDISFNWSIGSVAVNSMLDFADKWTTWIITPEIQIPQGPERGRFLNRMAKIEAWFKRRSPWFSNGVNMGTSYGLKGFALYAGYRNFMSAFVTARYDYQTNQSTATGLDKVSAVAGATLAVQDVLAEIGALGGNEFLKKRFPRMTFQMARLQTVFPSLMTTGGPSWGVGAARVMGIAGTAFAGLNVIAMFTSGVTTVISSYRSRTQSLSRGDYTAANFYMVGIIGGVVMTSGAIVFGVALWQAGAAVSATGVGATVGVVLFLVGGIIAAIGSIFGSLFSSDDYEVFARKCFLGIDGKREPRFSFDAGNGQKVLMDPPDWSMAEKSGTKTWEIDKQKRGILNLLGKFKVKTEFIKADPKQLNSQPTIKMNISPGLFMDGNTIEIALHYKSETENTVAKLEFDVPNATHSFSPSVGKGNLFTAENLIAPRTFYKGTVVIKVTISKLNYEPKRGSLLTTVTMRNPNHDFVIRVKKLVDNDEVESGLFK